MTDIDLVRLNFNPQTLLLLNFVLGFVMFGVSLELKPDDFKEALRTPRALVIGLLGHHLVFPAFTFLLVLLLEPRPSIALGMILVSSCPAGNISNFLTHFAKGNTALSVSISTLSTLTAIVMTPVNIAFWGGLYGPAQPLLRSVAVNPLEMFLHVLLLLGLPLAAGLYVSRRWRPTGSTSCFTSAWWSPSSSCITPRPCLPATGWPTAPGCPSATGAPWPSSAASRIPASA
jgi:BASS family bile acid:Na+ symporter